MKIKSTLFLLIGSMGMLGMAFFFMSGDHNDSPSVSGTTADIADFYAFESPENAENLVLIMNIQGLIPPGSPTEEAAFDENILMEFNIDLDNDLIEDVRLQAIKRGDSMFFFGPYLTAEKGLKSSVNIDAERKNKVKISTKEEVEIEVNNGMKFFAGPREDPFFFDRARFDAYMAGSAASGFNNPGTDNYAGTNVLSVVVEVPKNLLGNPATNVNLFDPNTPIYNMWVSTKRKTR